MTINILDTYRIADSTAYTLADADTLVITSRGALISSGGTTIGQYGGRFTNAGLVQADYTGVVTLGSGALEFNNTATGAIYAKNTAYGGVGNAFDYGYYGNESGAAAVNNAGQITSSGGVAVGLASRFGKGEALSVLNTGAISGWSAGVALYASGTATVRNHGLIEARNDASGYYPTALHAESGAGLITSVLNDGVITSPHSALGVRGSYVLDNSGTIHGGHQAITSISYNGDTASTATIHNSGLVEGGVFLAGWNDLLVNTGRIVGDIWAGDGADTLDNTHGVVTGVISGGLGADTIFGGGGREIIYGDNVSGDTSGGADVVYGGAGDDIVNGGYGADALYGNQGDDILSGNQDDDWMHGGQGNDVLYGGQGNDTLNGGVGDDVVFGNLGADIFAFSGPGFGHDTIGDFSRVAGNMDVVSFGPGVFSSFAELQAHATQAPAGVVLTDAAGDTVMLVGVTIGALTPAMFTFS